MYQNTLKNLYSTALDQELAKKMFKNGALVWINAQKAIPLHQVFHGISLSFRCRETIREDRFPFFVPFSRPFLSQFLVQRKNTGDRFRDESWWSGGCVVTKRIGWGDAIGIRQW